MKFNLLISSLLCIVLFTSCENPISMKTKVHEDGSLDKTIILEKTNDFRAEKNMFGINQDKGWTVNSIKLSDSAQRYRIEFTKSFKSAEEANLELDNKSDSLFRIQSTFEKKFRWFYTYITYTETFKAINRFNLVSADDYFNQEDHSFIDRLPGEGKSISKADSIYMETLNQKIAERFVNMAILEEQLEILKEVMGRNGIDKQWEDSLKKEKELIYNIIDEDKGNPRLAEKIADTLKIPLPQPQASGDFKELSKDFNSRLSFMGFANDGQYVNEVEMPWTITNSNADSAYNNTLVWRPLATKFAFKDYTMVAEARKLNLWAVVISCIFLLVAIYFVVKKN